MNPVSTVVSAVRVGGGIARTVVETEAWKVPRPDRVLRAATRVRGGVGLSTAGAVGSALWPDRVAIHDERGEVLHHELHRQVDALVAGLAPLGAQEGRRVGVLCRNHRGFVQAALAVSASGAGLVPLNTDFAGPQLLEVLAREGVSLVVHDDEFTPLLERFDGERVLAWHDGPTGLPTLERLIAAGGERPERRPEPGGVVLLTSGTTGTPKGAPRAIGVEAGSGLAAAPAAVDLLSRLHPLPRSGDPLVVAPPLNHMFGLGAMAGGLALGAPLVLRRQFDAEALLGDLARHRAGALCVVPTMLARIVALPDEIFGRHDLASLRLIATGAAPLSAHLAAAVRERFGDVLYNGYGSSEAGGVTLATPADLRDAPGTVGRALPGVSLKILDDDGREVRRGEVGRVFVGSTQLFEGYTGGGGRPMVDGLLGIGDVGRLDDRGRLFLEGRDDEMIVSGGENVYPQEVEEFLAAHPDVLEAAAVGVPDADFGERLIAFVVPVAGAAPDEETLRSHVRSGLARYKVPRSITVVDALPRTSTGKVKRARLRARADPAQDEER